MEIEKLQEIAKWIRYQILVSRTEPGSGHPTTSLAATDLMTCLFFGGFFHFFINDTKYPNNDRLIFSKGHGSPLFYSLWAAAGAFDSKELLTLRKFGSRLEGHPTPEFPYTEAATGSLGQGLSVGVGMALNAKYLDKIDYKTFVLLGDSEMFEGQIWEAAALASHYKLDNLIAIVDVNRIGQANETIHGWNLKAYDDKLTAFGWQTMIIDGHNYKQIIKAYQSAYLNKDKPFAIIAKTVKGKGISFLENRMGHHGVALKSEELNKALDELGKINDSLIPAILAIPKKNQKSKIKNQNEKSKVKNFDYQLGDLIATRKAYGNALTRIGDLYPQLVVLDAEVKNSTYAETFEKQYPDRFFEMYIGEQNMVSIALGLSQRGKIPFCSTFAAFFSRAFDQIRMCQYSNANIKFVGSHSGVSIGEDGSSQMGLEDLAMFSSLLNSIVLYPADAVSTDILVEEAANFKGIVYIRTTRSDTPILYNNRESFPIGGSKTLKSSKKDAITVVAAGITLHEALKAYEILVKQDIYIRVIDLYSIKPIDTQSLIKACEQTSAIVTIEDHYPHGGLGSAVNLALSSFSNRKPIYHLSVTKLPKSGKPDELLAYEQINAEAIVKKIKEIV